MDFSHAFCLKLEDVLSLFVIVVLDELFQETQ